MSVRLSRDGSLRFPESRRHGGLKSSTSRGQVLRGHERKDVGPALVTRLGLALLSDGRRPFGTRVGAVLRSDSDSDGRTLRRLGQGSDPPSRFFCRDSRQRPPLEDGGLSCRLPPRHGLGAGGTQPQSLVVSATVSPEKTHRSVFSVVPPVAHKAVGT